MNTHFSKKLKEIISLSREQAELLGNDSIDNAHLLLALIQEGENDAARLLKSYPIDLADLQKRIEGKMLAETGKQKRISRYPLTKDAEETIRGMAEEAKAVKHFEITAGDMMLAILKNRENIAGQILNQFHIDYDSFKNKVASN